MQWEIQWELVENLRDVGIVVFGIMGVWIGIVHPKSLKELFASGYKISNDFRRIKELLHPIRVATLIVIYSLLINLAYNLYHPSMNAKALDIFLKINLVLIITFTLGLILALLQTLIPLSHTTDDLNNYKEQEKKNSIFRDNNSWKDEDKKSKP